MSEKSKLEQWLCEITDQKDVDAAKNVITNYIEIVKAVPKLNMVSMLVSPGGGLLSITTSLNNQSEETYDDMETAFMEAQRMTKQARKQLKQDHKNMETKQDAN